MNKILNIILEEIKYFHKNVLNESVSDIMYHFTYVSKLYNILKTNEIFLSPNFVNSSDNKSKNLYFLSLSTSRSLSVGYGASLGTNEIARLTMNGRVLNQNYESQAVDYWGYTRDPKKATVDNMSRYDELEERLITDKDRIKPANKYITGIEILNAKPEHASAIKLLCDNLNIEFYAYDDEKYFSNSIKNKAINLEPVDANIENNNRDNKINLRDLSEILAYLTFKDEDLKNKIFNELSKFDFDLEQIKIRVNEIQKSKLHYYLNYEDDFRITDLSNSIQATLHNNMKSTHDAMRYIVREFGIDMKNNNVRTLKDYLKYKIWKGRKRQKQFNIEFNEKISIFIDKIYQEKLDELKGYNYYGEIGNEYYDNIYEYPAIKSLLDSKIQELKEFYGNFILNNNDLFKYSYEIGNGQANKYLKIGEYSEDGYDPQFNDVLNGIDTEVNANDLTNIFRYIIYDVNDATSDEIKSIKAEYNNQFTS